MNDKSHRSRPCPVCREPAVVKYRPFCSVRCADLDLGRWFSGRYAIPSDEPAGDNDGPDPDADA